MGGQNDETNGTMWTLRRYTMQSPQQEGFFMHLRSRGFTLMELMIVVAIVAILAAIAFPSFMEQVRGARRGDALAETGRMQLALERWRADNPSYAGSGTLYPVPTNSSHYTFALSGQNATTYSLTATRVGTQANDRCGNLTAVAGGKPTWATPACNN